MTKKIEAAQFEGGVAVTGAAGFLGGVIVRLLAASGVRVHSIARHPVPAAAGVTSHGWDPTRDTGAPVPGLEVDAVIDCAAALPSRVADPVALKQINARLVGGALDLAGRRGGRLIFMSSQSVYGRPTGDRIGTDTPLAPIIPYGEAKRDAEAAVTEAVAAGRLAGAAVLRLPAVVGPGAHDTFPAGTAGKLQRGEPVTVFNPDSPYNAVVAVEDLAHFAAHLAGTVEGLAVASPASDPPTTVRAAVEAIAAGLGCAASLNFEEAPYGSPLIDSGPAFALGLAARSSESVLFGFGQSLSDSQARANKACPGAGKTSMLANKE